MKAQVKTVSGQSSLEKLSSVSSPTEKKEQAPSSEGSELLSQLLQLDETESAEEAFVDNLGRYPWLNNQAEDAYKKLGRGIASFDVVFAYPWPGESCRKPEIKS